MKSAMKRGLAALLAVLTVLSLAGCGAQKGAAEDTGKWDCSVSCAEGASGGYVITYSDQTVTCKTGTLTLQNRNEFDIKVHLLSAGAQELVSESIPAGGSFSFLQAPDGAYTVGVHAEVEEGTDILLFVYDGDTTEVYM